MFEIKSSLEKPASLLASSIETSSAIIQLKEECISMEQSKLQSIRVCEVRDNPRCGHSSSSS